MRAFEVLVALAAAAPFGARVPGTALRMGATLAQLDSTLGTRGADADAEGRASRKTSVRFFGTPGNATLTTTSGGGLETVHLELPALSAHTLDYIGDEMRRLGYHGTCERGNQLSCDWSGALDVHLETGRDRVVVDVRRVALAADAAPGGGALAAGPGGAGGGATPAADSSHVAATAAPALAAPTAASADAVDTLLAVLPGETAPPGERVAHVLRLPIAPAYPEAARRAGVQGVVRLVVDVDETGSVTAAHVVKSIRELDPSAVAAARAAHFEVVSRAGRPAPYRARLAFRFTVP